MAEVVFGGAHYRILFLLGTLLFAVTFVTNLIGDVIMHRLKARLEGELMTMTLQTSDRLDWRSARRSLAVTGDRRRCSSWPCSSSFSATSSGTARRRFRCGSSSAAPAKGCSTRNRPASSR